MKRRHNPPADESIRDSVWYHGTDSEEAARGIMTNGIVPGDIIEQKKGGGFLKPVAGRVYMTKDLSYAVIYALGRSCVGDDFGDDEPKDPYGFLFEISGSSLTDVQPDEDSVGAAVALGLSRYKRTRPSDFEAAILSNRSLLGRLVSMASATTTPDRLRKVADGFVANQAQLGKQMLRKMPDHMKMELIRAGAHVSHGGAVFPSQAWIIKKQHSIRLSPDCANFFKVAKRVEAKE